MTVHALRVIPLVVSLTVAALLAGCSSHAAESAEQSADPTSPAASASEPAFDPDVFLGKWEVTGTDTSADGTTVEFTTGEREATIEADCGTMIGQWAANDEGFFLGSLTSWSGLCQQKGTSVDDDSGPEAQLTAWFTTAHSYQRSGVTVKLYNSAESLLVTLKPLDSDEKDTVSASADASGTMSAATPLDSASVTPEDENLVTSARLAGKWVQIGRPQDAPTPPYLQFDTDGTWSGSDGCNAQSGRWLLSDDGEILATAGPQTLMACTGMANLGSTLTFARTAVLSASGVLTLYSVNGTALQQLVRSDPDAAATAEDQ